MDGCMGTNRSAWNRIRRGMVSLLTLFWVCVGLLSSSFVYSAADKTDSTVRLLKVSGMELPHQQVRLELEFSQALKSKPKMFMVKKPIQLVMDFEQVRNGTDTNSSLSKLNYVQQSFVAESSGRTRVVFSLQQQVLYSLKQEKNKWIITLVPEISSVTSSQKTSFTQPQKQETAESTPKRYIQGLSFNRIDEQGGSFVVAMTKTKSPISVSQQNGQLVVLFQNTAIADQWLKHIDVSDFATPLKKVMVSREGVDVKMLFNVVGRYQHVAYQIDQKFVVEFKPVASAMGMGDKKSYTGKRLSLNLQDIPVRSVLQILSDFTGLNLVVGDTVRGNVTLNLQNVPWDEALDIILKTHGLAQRKMGDVILIAPNQEISAREQEEFKAAKAIEALAPTQSELIQVNYAKAADVMALIKGQNNNLLSAQGQISVDTRTNNLWVLDVPERIQSIRDLVQKLDVPVRQVQIESRVVNVDKSFEDHMGFLFGVSKPNMHMVGSWAGSNYNENGDSITSSTTASSRLNFNLPSSDTSAPRVGLALARLGHGFMLDLELSAIESEGKGELISSPHLITSDQQEATIEAGEEIPYQSVSSSGATTVSFKKAVLSLKVTPQITPDNKVLLKLAIHQDKRSSLPEILGTPAIDTRSVETNVLVDNGETIVLGGIFVRDYRNTVKRIPFISEIPVLGELFKQKDKTDKHNELLVFVTPKIIQQSYLQQSDHRS